jgi:hypothetical protein
LAAQPASQPANKPAIDSLISKKQQVTYKLIQAEGQGFGYEIFVDNHLFIHQPVIPCVAGNKGFRTTGDARKTALLVISKIRKGLIPPSVTVSEMQKLGIDLR